MIRKRKRSPSAWPHRTGYLLAWRAFDVYDRGVQLHSLNAHSPWPKRRPFRATCHCASYFASSFRHHAPAHDGSCGIYALKRRRDAEGFGGILGRVALWGRVIVHAAGYRAEYAYPQALYVPEYRRNGKVRIAKHYRALGRAYGIEVYPRSILDRPRTTKKGART